MPPWRPRRKNSEPFTLQIRPDRDYVLLKGTAHETRDSKILISGQVVIKSTDDCAIRHGVHLRLWGRLQTSHYGIRSTSSLQPGPFIRNAKNILEISQELLDPDTGATVKSVKSGETKLPYLIELPGDISETVVGLTHTGVTFTMQAMLEKAMVRVLDFDVSGKKIKQERTLRIVRTLSDESRTELLDRAEQVGSWDPKCSYQFGSRSRAVPFGSEVGIDFQLTPAHPKITVGKIHLLLRERRRVKTWDPSADSYPRNDESKKGWWVVEQEVAKADFRLPINALQIDPVTQADTYIAKFWFDLPTSMNKCRQTIDDHSHIKIDHTLYYSVEVYNIDGHMSQINANHQIRLYISEHRPLNSENATSSVKATGTTLRTFQNTLEAVTQPPPLYDQHYLDDLFDESHVIPPRTPCAHSGAATPSLGTSSRSSSHGNLVSMTASSQDPLPQDLSERLAQHLHTSQHAPSNLRGSTSTDVSPEASRNNSVTEPTPNSSSPEQGATTTHGEHQTTQHNTSITPRTAWNIQALSRLNSYETATRTPPNASEDEPPSYEAAISRPPSPPRRKTS
ncbi:MAG: hypothetical protein Q9159_004357 [Coniocarpon cinnabarinum]